MDKKKQIEEMTKIIEKTFSYAKKYYDDKYEPFELEVYPDEISKALYNANCRIIPEGSVVLTKEEHIEILGKIKMLQQLRNAITTLANDFGIKPNFTNHTGDPDWN